MADKIKVRRVTPLLSAFRNFLLGRKHRVPERATLRYAPLVAKRDQLPPILPDGPSHKLSANSYCQRDGRRETHPPEVLAVGSAKRLLPAGKVDSPKDVAVAQEPIRKVRFPGKMYSWD